jgi:hypothetical protein
MTNPPNSRDYILSATFDDGLELREGASNSLHKCHAAEMRQLIAAALAIGPLCFASQSAFSVNDDLLAFPQVRCLLKLPSLVVVPTDEPSTM